MQGSSKTASACLSALRGNINPVANGAGIYKPKPAISRKHHTSVAIVSEKITIVSKFDARLLTTHMRRRANKVTYTSSERDQLAGGTGRQTMLARTPWYSLIVCCAALQVKLQLWHLRHTLLFRCKVTTVSSRRPMFQLTSLKSIDTLADINTWLQGRASYPSAWASSVHGDRDHGGGLRIFVSLLQESAWFVG